MSELTYLLQKIQKLPANTVITAKILIELVEKAQDKEENDENMLRNIENM